MTSMSRLLLSLAAVAACATAHAAPYDRDDQARRDRNREEVMAKHGLGAGDSYRADGSVRVEEKKTVKSQARRAVDATKNLGHRTADKMRRIGDKANARFPGPRSPAKDPYKHGPS